MEKINKKLIFKKFFLLIFAVFLKVFSHPNFVSTNGFGFLAWFSYFPLLILLSLISFKSTFIYAFFYSLFFCSLYGFWIINYGVFSYIVVLSVNFIIYLVLFYLIKICINLFPKNNWIIIFFILCSFEYLQTKGFLGFNYGISAYSQWRYISLIQIVDCIGVFGLNLLIIFPSCALFKIYDNKNKLKKYKINQETNLNQFEYESHMSFIQKNKMILHKYSNLFIYIICFLYFILTVFIFLYSSSKNFDNFKYIKVGAVQSCDFPDENDINSYIENFQVLYSLTNSMLEMNDDVKFVLWPENSIVPSIAFKHNLSDKVVKMSEVDYLTQDFLNKVLSYFKSKKNITFIIGNNHVEINDNYSISNYNAALIFDCYTQYEPFYTNIYKKTHLVPFTEGFPYKSLFPALYKKLSNEFGDLYEYGTEFSVFESNGIKFSTPICFEDTFSDISRKMVLNGARCLFNISNDSWSNSKVCQYQHLSMSVFRAVENRVPLVKCGTTGQTCIINLDGTISQMIEPFNKYYVVGDIPVIDETQKPTFYSLYGHYIFEEGISIFTFLLLLISLITVIIKKSKEN